MAQADYIISNQTFPNTRADINNHLSAIATNNSGTSAPTTQYAGQFWIDTTTTTWTLYIHDGTDDIQFATIDTSANTVNFTDSALDVVTDTTPQLGGDLDLNSNDITGTGNINITGNLTATGNLTSTGIDDNATSTAITIDSNETSTLQCSAGDSNFALLAYHPTSTSTRTIAKFQSNVGGTQEDKVVIQTSGNVGIGTSSPANLLHLEASDVTMRLEDTDASGYALISTTGNSDLQFKADDGNNDANSKITFDVDGPERMRIDSSGNVLVGKTSTGIGTEGVQFEGATGQIVATSDGQASLFLNRLTSDGDILDLRKDGTTIGSIGNSGTALLFNNPNANSYFAFHANNQSTGIFFQDGTQKILSPYASRSNEFDLGSTSGKWKDLYLGGNIYLGGTGSANALDDYEEGTWTPIISNGTITSGDTKYIKIGKQVHLGGYIANFSDITTAQNVKITGIPFQVNGTFAGGVIGRYFSAGIGGDALHYYMQDNTSQIIFYITANNSNFEALQHADLTSTSVEIYFSISYQTD